MKRLFRLWRAYSLLSLAVLAAIIGVILGQTKHGKITHLFLSLVSIGLLMPLLWEMWQSLRAGRYGVNLLAALSVITALVLGQYWTALALIILMTGSKVLQVFAIGRAKQDLNHLSAMAPKTAVVIRKGKTLETRASELHTGDKIIIAAGEQVPADCQIIDGASSFDESLLTGLASPAGKQVGDKLLAGSFNLENTVTAKVTAALPDSHYQQVNRVLGAAASSSAPFIKLTELYALPFMLLALAIGLAAWAITGQAIRLLDVLVVTSPAAMIIAPQVTLTAGLISAGRHGIIIKNGRTLQRLAEARTFAFNQTGTLTSDRIAVDDIKTFGKFSQAEVLKLAASLEQTSNHPVAVAIVNEARGRQLKLAKTKHSNEVAGRGLSATLQGQPVLIGRLSFIEDEGIMLPPRFKPQAIKKTTVYVALNGELAGVITLKTEPRPEAQATLAGLKRLGVRQTLLLTGDNLAAADSLSAQIGIDEVKAGLLAADKIRMIEQTKPKPVAYVSASVKEAPTLTAADVGIALNSAGRGGSDSADILIMPDDLSRLAIARYIAKRTLQTSRQTMLIGILISLGLMAVFVLGKLPPLAGVCAQSLVNSTIVALSLRAKHIAVSD